MPQERSAADPAVELLRRGVATVVLEDTRLYHGSATPGIRQLDRAEEDTVGAGVYLTDGPTARDYARHRAGASGTAVVYGVEVTRARLVNLTDRDTVTEVMTGFRSVLMWEMVHAIDADAPWYQVDDLSQMIENIDNGHGSQVGTIRFVTSRSRELFTQYLQDRGFDGVVAAEGSEGGIGAHYSYVLFDPAALRIISQDTIAVTDDPDASWQSDQAISRHRTERGEQTGKTARGPAALLDAAFPPDRSTERGEPDSLHRALPDAGPHIVSENDTGL
ncbi:hypothetical protein [Nocardia sp. GAS34]|uniref:hypothetical protein n=1 Tax=unclassified Nocardia TaxID=2637762 RepID=UPI003D210407